MEESPSVSLSKVESAPSVKKPKRDDTKDLALCRYFFPLQFLNLVCRFQLQVLISNIIFCSVILNEMETHEDAWPFLLPVNLKLVPGYKKVIKKPMDFSTIREKLNNGQ